MINLSYLARILRNSFLEIRTQSRKGDFQKLHIIPEERRSTKLVRGLGQLSITLTWRIFNQSYLKSIIKHCLWSVKYMKTISSGLLVKIGKEENSITKINYSREDPSIRVLFWKIILQSLKISHNNLKRNWQNANFIKSVSSEMERNSKRLKSLAFRGHLHLVRRKKLRI